MAERFAPGDRVRVRLLDPVGHTRAPGYVRGHVGEVVGHRGRHPLPDAVVAGERPEPSAVYAVRFEAAGIWGGGEHTVTVDLWDEYLEPGTGELSSGEAGTAKPGSAKPGSGRPATGEPDTGEPDTGEPDTGEPDTGEADTGEADTGEADTGEADTGGVGIGEPRNDKPGSENQGGWGRTNHGS